MADAARVVEIEDKRRTVASHPPPPRLCSCIPPEGRIGPRHGRGWAEAARLVEHENERRTDELEDERRTAELEDERRRDGGRR